MHHSADVFCGHNQCIQQPMKSKHIKEPTVSKPIAIRQCVRVGLLAPSQVTSVNVGIDVVNKLNSEIPIDVSPLF